MYLSTLALSSARRAVAFAAGTGMITRQCALGAQADARGEQLEAARAGTAARQRQSRAERELVLGKMAAQHGRLRAAAQAQRQAARGGDNGAQGRASLPAAVLRDL